VDAFLRWSNPDLLDDRLLHCCAVWHVLSALALDPAAVPAPQRGSVSELTVQGMALMISSARVLADRSTVFSLGTSSHTTPLLCLLEPGSQPIEPLDPGQWQFWLVPRQRFSSDRQTVGLHPLRRSQGDGLSHASLAGAIAARAAAAVDLNQEA